MSKKRRRWVYPLELATAAALGVIFLLAVLALLSWIFPGGTGLGDLIRSPDRARQSAGRFRPGDGAEASVAVLEGIRHNVQDRPQSSVVWSKAAAGAALGDRHAVQTLESSGATIAFDENTMIELGERTLIVVRRPSEIVGRSRKRASVLFMDGLLRGRIGGAARSDLDLEIATPSGVVHAASDQGSVQVALAVEQGASELSVVEGAVSVEWGGKRTTVPEGHFVTYDSSHAPSPPSPISPRPRIVSPAVGAKLGIGTTPKPVVFEWRSPEHVATVRLEVARDPQFEQLVFDERVKGNRFVHENLGAGSYHWRVTGQSDASSGTSERGHFVVIEDDEPPGLRIELPDEITAGSQVTLRGETEPDCRVFIGDTAVPTREGRFEHSLQVHEGYNFVVVQAIDPNGNTSFRNHTILARAVTTERVP